MPLVGVRELKTKASEVFRTVRQKKEEFIITYKGKPFAILVPLSEEELEDYILAGHPHFIKERKFSREEVRKGEKVTTKELKKLAEGGS